jgi:hypothetical protein
MFVTEQAHPNKKIAIKIDTKINKLKRYQYKIILLSTIIRYYIIIIYCDLCH